MGLTDQELKDLTSLVVQPSWYVQVPGSQLPNWIHFKHKVVDAICLRSDSASGFFYMADYRRLDRDPKSGLWVLDQEPFLLAVLPTNTLSLTSGMYIHDGDWSGRTQPIPSAVASAFVKTLIASLWPLPWGPAPHVGANH